MAFPKTLSTANQIIIAFGLSVVTGAPLINILDDSNNLYAFGDIAPSASFVNLVFGAFLAFFFWISFFSFGFEAGSKKKFLISISGILLLTLIILRPMFLYACVFSVVGAVLGLILNRARTAKRKA